MRSSRLAVALLAGGVLLAGCTGTGGGEGGGGEASCAAVLEIDGRTYLGHGDLRREPAVTGRNLEALVPGCDDTGGQDDPEPARTARAQELADVPAAVAVLLDGSVYVREGEDLPPAARAWFDSPTCEHAGVVELTGAWLGVTGPHEAQFDGDIRPPYRIEVAVTAGQAAYLGTTLRLQVTAATDPLLGPDDVRETLWTGGEVSARVRCDGDRFVATAVRSAG
ncbi:hypothetical protein GGQ22_04905 [Nocardioides sp. zg-579]|uniref:Lipoprotein n=1 Tax=Nocardioides marmotae TaxID=2663857 RepID=A0A6I3J212_9ACTN|nr:DUF6281 family protein [Nocardioides marmotae]MCR6030782.1 hypothetical protein [Gordonia jinghuaiqii]MTB94416.1 hypothetical protein [Nocardioides marmotae]QKE01561.1 hypothetical protein HPC71_11090 [Nocardioides marmotae]